jgi:hypothetical protein
MTRRRPQKGRPTPATGRTGQEARRAKPSAPEQAQAKVEAVPNAPRWPAPLSEEERHALEAGWNFLE